MRIDKDATPFIAATALPAVAAAIAGKRVAAYALGALSLAVTAFFRDPQRFPDLPVEVDRDIVLAPADGRVMHAGPAQEQLAPPGKWQQVSIFLSLTDVHINRTPYGGTVTDVQYRPGRYLAAFRDESGVQNERSEITVQREVHGEQRTVIFRQIVGLLARRVVTRVRPGDQIKPGQRIGLMKFGSRMDIFIPYDAHLLVSTGDRVIAGESTLARWPQPQGRDR